MSDERTTAAIHAYLRDLAGVNGRSAAEPVIGALLSRAANRLHLLCAKLLYRSYPRLARPPLNLEADELLGAVVARLLTALREVRPTTIRQFFALATRHMRWELNDLARKLDGQARTVELNDPAAPPPRQDASGSPASPKLVRVLAAIEALPADEREVFDLVRIQGLTHVEAADVTGVSTKTIQRRLNRCVLLLSESLADLRPPPAAPRDGRPS